MAVQPLSFSTGVANLPDVGQLTYNGVTFSSLFRSTVSWKLIPDNAGRTVKQADITIEAEGYVTPANAGVLGFVLTPSADKIMSNLRFKLSQNGGNLIYSGRGFGPLNVNPPGQQFSSSAYDVNWGPKVELLDFRTLGGGLCALASVRITTSINEQAFLPAAGVRLVAPLLQFNEGISLTYDEDCYCGLSVKGTLEIPLTWIAANNRAISDTVDRFRQRFLDFNVDLTRFKVTRRNFDYSRDRRTCEWEYAIQEQAPMGNPPGVPTARGTCSVANLPPKGGKGYAGGFIAWDCSLNCTYTVAKGLPRRLAWDAFLSLLQWRLMWGALGYCPAVGNQANKNQNPAPPTLPAEAKAAISNVKGVDDLGAVYNQLLDFEQKTVQAALIKQNAFGGADGQKTFLYHFGFREGLYEDSRTMTFEASWKLLSSFTHVLIGSGVWRWLGGTVGGNLWAQSVRNISGWKGNLANRIDPLAEAIVDLGNQNP